MGSPWLAINAVHRDSLSTSRAVKSFELRRNPKLSTEKQEPDKGHSDHRDLTLMISNNRIDGPGSA